jgi:hypothetical protein
MVHFGCILAFPNETMFERMLLEKPNTNELVLPPTYVYDLNVTRRCNTSLLFSPGTRRPLA